MEIIEVIKVQKSFQGYGHWIVRVTAKVGGMWRELKAHTNNSIMIDNFDEDAEVRKDLASYVLLQNDIDHDDVRLFE